ncbi:MAG: dephospho-CoA kinase [Clostridia bacterium]|nr:dephospho-CoA kinase [Clostridia bacterium]
MVTIIGLTGRSGTGKSVVVSAASKLHIPSLDCDRLYRSMTDRPSPLQEEIASAFGRDAVMKEDGRLNRAFLRDRVYEHPEAMRRLNELTGRYIGGFIKDLAASLEGSGFLLLDAPTLYQTGIDGVCRRIICLLSPEEACRKRIMERDGISREDADLRLNSQLPDEFYLSSGAYILRNEGTEEELFANAVRMLKSVVKEIRNENR